MKTISTLIFLISFNLAFCQTDGKTCATAHEIPEEEISCINKVVEENQIWLKFKATQTFINLSITNDYQLDAIELFSGSCNSLTSIVKTGRRHIEYSHLNLNEFYYFSITGANQELSLITKNINTTTFPNCTFTDVSGCVKVPKKGGFKILPLNTI